MRLYKRHFALTATWNNISSRWQVFLYETNKHYDPQYNVAMWYPIELQYNINKDDIEQARKNSFRKAVILICNKYEDESTRIVEHMHQLH